VDKIRITTVKSKPPIATDYHAQETTVGSMVEMIATDYQIVLI
jgi:hypothetical protein